MKILIAAESHSRLFDYSVSAAAVDTRTIEREIIEDYVQRHDTDSLSIEWRPSIDTEADNYYVYVNNAANDLAVYRVRRLELKGVGDAMG